MLLIQQDVVPKILQRRKGHKKNTALPALVCESNSSIADFEATLFT